MKKQQIVSLAVGSAFAAVALSPAVHAAGNPFSATPLQATHQLAAADKAGEGKCGGDKKSEAKCGADKKKSEARCGADKKAAEAKCGADKKPDMKDGAK